MKYQVIYEVEADSPKEAATKTLFHHKGSKRGENTSYTVTDGTTTWEDVRPCSDGGLRTLTERELQVADLIMQGASNGDISKTLKITSGTTKTHVSHIFDKLNVNSRVGLVMALYSAMEKRKAHADKAA